MVETLRDPVTHEGMRVVGGEGRISANSATQEHNVCHEDGEAYFANTTDTADTLTLAAGNTYNILFIKNTHTTKDLIIEKIFPSVDTAGVVMVFISGQTEGTITNANTHSPVNNKVGSGNPATGTFYNWDEVGTSGITGLTGGTKHSSYILASSSLPQPIDGAIILPQGQSFCVQLINGTAGAIEAAVGLRMYYDDRE